MFKEVTVTISDNIYIDTRGNMVVDGKTLVGVNPDDTLAAALLKKEAVKMLSAAKFISDRQVKRKEQEIITVMYDLYNKFYNFPFKQNVLDQLLDGTTVLAAQQKWRALAEYAVSLKD